MTLQEMRDRVLDYGRSIQPKARWTCERDSRVSGALMCTAYLNGWYAAGVLKFEFFRGHAHWQWRDILDRMVENLKNPQQAAIDIEKTISSLKLPRDLSRWSN